MEHPQKKKRSRVAVLIAILLILFLVIGWHFVLPMLGLTLAFTGTVWGVMMGSVVVLAIAALLFFILTGVGVFILGLSMLAGAALVIAFFPILFPIIVPLIILLLLIGFLFGRSG